jgi:hypothetical protein
MQVKTVLTINSQDIHSDFHTSVYRLATLPLKQTYANVAICLHVNLVSTNHAQNILDQKDFYSGETGLRARGYRNEVEGNHKFRAILVSKLHLEISQLKTVRCYTQTEQSLTRTYLLNSNATKHNIFFFFLSIFFSFLFRFFSSFFIFYFFFIHFFFSKQK